MTAKTPEPRAVEPVSPRELRIEWKDGVVTFYRARQLRLACPCAECVEEWTGRKLLRPERVPEDLTLRNTELVGRYALTFQWSDGHQTGIFSFDFLRRLAAVDGDKAEPAGD